MFLKSQMFFFALNGFFFSLMFWNEIPNVLSSVKWFGMEFQTFLYSPKWMVWNRITSVLHYQKMATLYRLSPRNGWLSIYPKEASLIFGGRLYVGVLVVDAEEEGGDGVLLADGKEDSENKRNGVLKKGGPFMSCALSPKGRKPVKFVMVLSCRLPYTVYY
jgi:hypothetical protein